MSLTTITAGGRVTRLAIAITLAVLLGAVATAGAATGGAVDPAKADLVASRPDPEGVPTPVSIGFYLVDIESV